MSFVAPTGYEIVYEEIVNRIHSYIKLKYWDKIDHKQLSDWLENFKNPEERYLSILILHKIMYRNSEAIQSTINNIFHILLPNYLSKNNIMNVIDLEEWEGKLFDPSKRFSTTAPFRISTITTGDLGESGHTYMRILRDKFVTKDMLFDITRKDILYTKPSYVKTIIFIDDFIGTGTQIKEFLKDNTNNLQLFKNIVFFPLVAHDTGITLIEETANELNLNISIIPVEKIDYNNSSFYFNDDDQVKFDGTNTIESLKIFCQNLAQKQQLESDMNNIFGFGNLAITHLFSTGTPDNNLPFIYKSKSATNWIALQEKR